ncbi:hypothetical protein [Neisseria sp.]|uniref:hypothetical protein n=1 Tax=Neisseria sp. TaxID=192066 RepID=UPI0026DC4F98|nr:hypothetical protein [Neisseria sp.]MDO4907709.1 hypothetical protein [Neisseria sp.]
MSVWFNCLDTDFCALQADNRAGVALAVRKQGRLKKREENKRQAGQGLVGYSGSSIFSDGPNDGF